MVERVVAVVVGAEIVVGVRRGVVKVHHVAEREAPPPSKPPQAALQVGGSAAHDAGHIHAAVGDGQISVYAALGGRHSEALAGAHHECLVHGCPLFVEARVEIGTRNGDDARRFRIRASGPAKANSMAGAFAALPTSRFPSGQRAAIHDARRREAARGVSHAATVLHGGQKTWYAHGEFRHLHRLLHAVFSRFQPAARPQFPHIHRGKWPRIQWNRPRHTKTPARVLHRRGAAGCGR